MRRLPNLALRLAHAQSGTHGARQPRPGLRQGWPTALIQPTQYHHIRLHKTCFQRANIISLGLTGLCGRTGWRYKPHVEKRRPIGFRHMSRQNALRAQIIENGKQRPPSSPSNSAPSCTSPSFSCIKAVATATSASICASIGAGSGNDTRPKGHFKTRQHGLKSASCGCLSFIAKAARKAGKPPFRRGPRKGAFQSSCQRHMPASRLAQMHQRVFQHGKACNRRKIRGHASQNAP